MIVLGIETSCDETASAVYDDGTLLSNVISSQEIHKKYGGVVPELASRAHQRLIVPVVEQSLRKAKLKKNQIEGISVTVGPGLVGSLLVGISFTKALALGLGISFIGVNHLEAHLWSWKIGNLSRGKPFIGLVISGGHCILTCVERFGKYQFLGSTKDDAPGEAFDKVAKLLNLGYPGGPVIDRISKKGNRNFVRFPRPGIKSNGYDFSFSGLKTAVLYYLRKHKKTYIEKHIADICASFQQSIIDVLIKKSFDAACSKRVDMIAVTGGVAANSSLQKAFRDRGEKEGIEIIIPEPVYCTDNAAMIAQLGCWKLRNGEKSDFSITALPSYPFPCSI
ncbi:tRNA (adenosine(37)-N6)-threonylcarbamoyltransferase complex transferase subunit TsaD [candidate division KSB1 bacterium]|nr:MAG: tRNA (adenosine(37)-N6)-threonylcarbamoyltransferase complex transferase subunit TsaD [candidate division KSB1 bacterium]